jgi:hypothetical protein
VSETAPAIPSTPLEHAEMFAYCFRGNANSIAYAYGGPVYLFGSLITSDEPGDIDIRVHVAREDMIALFGEGIDQVGREWGQGGYRRGREELKQSRRLTRRWCKDHPTGRRRWAGRVDFQFVIALMADNGLPIFEERDTRPRIRLDDVPVSHFAAGRNDP